MNKRDGDDDDGVDWNTTSSNRESVDSMARRPDKARSVDSCCDAGCWGLDFFFRKSTIYTIAAPELASQ